MTNSPEQLKIILAEANNIATTPERLTAIYHNYQQPEIRQALICNPNTPKDILFVLGAEYPAELLANPVFDLLLLANPSLLKDLPKDTLISLLRLPNLNINYVLSALNHYVLSDLEHYLNADVFLTIITNHLEIWNKWRVKHLDLDINLYYSNLQEADLSYADLRNVYLKGANLKGANLKNANLKGVDLRGANLDYADLSNANLRSSDLRGVNLRCTDLTGADLTGADLKNAIF